MSIKSSVSIIYLFIYQNKWRKKLQIVFIFVYFIYLNKKRRKVDQVGVCLIKYNCIPTLVFNCIKINRNKNKTNYLNLYILICNNKFRHVKNNKYLNGTYENWSFIKLLIHIP
jgi:hypothetical protein